MKPLKFFRHKEYKDLYLVRTPVCGGNHTSPFYAVTPDVLAAIRSVITNDDFLGWYKRFPDNYVTTVIEKEFNLDGFSGKLKKEVNLPIEDFEMVTLCEDKVESPSDLIERGDC